MLHVRLGMSGSLAASAMGVELDFYWQFYWQSAIFFGPRYSLSAN